MTSPIDVAYVEILPDTKVFKAKARKDIDKELKGIESDADGTATKITDAFKKTGEGVRNVFRDSNGKLRDAEGKLVNDINETIGDGIGGAFKTAKSAYDSFVGVLSGLPGILGTLASSGPIGIAALVAGFILLTAVATAAAAAIQALITIAAAGLAALPGLIVGVIAGFGILTVALHGIMDAFKEQTTQAKKAGAAGANAGRQIADAQRGVLEAQKAVIKAREDELKRIREIQTALFRARVTEARAVDNVKNAQLALQAARALNSPRAVTEAQLQLDEANASLLEAKDRTKDLAADKAKADKNGVAGSEQVLRAQEQLRDAQDRLAASQAGFAASTAQAHVAFNGLAQSAQSFVTALVAAKTALKPVADAIQEAFFKDTGPLIDPIVQNIKSVQPELVRVADGFNNIFKEVLTFLGSDEGQKALESILTGLANFLDKVAPSIGPLLDAFAGLVGQSGEFGDNLGTIVADALTGIADFVKNVDLKKLFEDAKNAVNDLLPLIKPLLSLTISLFKIFAVVGKITLPQLAAAFNILANIIKGVEVVITPVFNFLSTFFTKLKKDPKEAVDFVVKTIKELPSKIGAIGVKMFDAGKDLVVQLFKGLGKAGGFVEDLGKKIANGLIKFINSAVISGINNGIKLVQDTLNKAPFFDLDLPRIPNIPQLAKGGVSTRNTIANISEGNKKEGILPLENPGAMKAVGEAISDAGGTGGGGDTFVTVMLGNDQLTPFAVKVVKGNNRKVARSVKQVPRMV